MANDQHTSGVYAIRCSINGKMYIGSAVNLKQRWVNHKKALRGRRHDNRHLQGAWNKYGEAFIFGVIEYVEVQYLIEREDFWIRYYGANKSLRGYNLRQHASSNRGMKHSVEALAKISATHKGKKLSEQHIAQMKARVCSDETRAKMSAAALGRKASDETRAKMAAVRRGKKRSEEIKAKLRASPAMMAQVARLAEINRSRKRRTKSQQAFPFLAS